MENALRHIAFIMDGNGRWAKKRGLVRTIGHEKGASNLRKIVQEAARTNLEYLTVYAFSSENWGRSPEEVRFLFRLFDNYLREAEKELLANNVKVRILGSEDGVPSELIKNIKRLEKLSEQCGGLCLQIAFNYGGRAEILGAAKRLAKAASTGQINLDNFGEKSFQQFLYSSQTPDPDILIRTGGEQRVSNYLLWQLAYTELFFIKKGWPDFSWKDVEDIVQDYRSRERRFGRLSA